MFPAEEIAQHFEVSYLAELLFKLEHNQRQGPQPVRNPEWQRCIVFHSLRLPAHLFLARLWRATGDWLGTERVLSTLDNTCQPAKDTAHNDAMGSSETIS